MSFNSDLRRYNRRLARGCRTYGMNFRLFKLLKATLQLVGAAAGIYAMMLGAPPLAALAMITVMVSGPEAMEYLIEDSAPPGDDG